HPGRTADEVRACPQSHDREGSGPYNSVHADRPRRRGDRMRRREFMTLLGGTVAAWPIAARAQQTERMRRLGILMAVSESDADARKGIGILQERLQKLGWKDGNNIQIDCRWGNGNPDRIQDLAKELVELRPDVLVGHSTPSAKGLLKQTHTIPIVFLTVTDPLGQGLISTLSPP